ncbi:pyrroline-5-carboxylate reductase [Xylella fastidiosa]|uniref:pyrroline-5-carboxylate reductase n=1 Tax=Xylella fastidiosa TaxID=2371 RepID=UPI00058342DF|nr:pyrroline-5-carboxylate reductase [Xylella fastidiosa]AVI23602.1 pyrroline-5-carboxylate reductase [Xylella fastidiosa]KIA57414.1 pyrroline-5-carboxylate reductase [Xylella fastidiosa]KXB10625.1 pyrroline-5-carboxylate reductase [Xylella fastidiosa]KXB14336.1 pyrroline-5-carboxylate reductase [Xylella fastidiosa]
MITPFSSIAMPHVSLLPSPSPIAFIGGGNMARSMIAGMIRQGAPSTSICVIEPIAALRDALIADFNIKAVTTATEAATDTSTWVLAVKPQVMPDVCATLPLPVQPNTPLVISIAAGITTCKLKHWLGDTCAIVRAMPNTPALLGAGVTGLFATSHTTATQRTLAEELFNSVGKTLWITEEALMDAVTAVSGSGPAYAFLLAEAMEAAAIMQGLSTANARTLVQQTLLGAARMMTELGETPAALRHHVTSPHGTTEAAIATFQENDFQALVAKAIDAATRRARALGKANDTEPT